mmetsp:Transcript_5634/g.8166  ORF Transcript_5634/g.8166 Transcript_5634/m.8166 type:complete len:398 (+) Transcript_5634:21-1214(+)
MGRVFAITLIAVVAGAVVFLMNTENSHINNRVLRYETKQEIVQQNRHKVVEVLEADNEQLSATLSTYAHSYCSEKNSLEEYPLPNYNACEANSTLNVIPFVGGMTNALKFILLGALMSFQENRCFIVDEERSPLNPDDHSEQSFLNHYFEQIGLPHNDPFVVQAMAEGRVHTRYYQEYWDNLILRRVVQGKYNYKTAAYSHAENNVNGLALKRDFLRHMWHLQPSFRATTCQALKDHDIFDTDYIGLSIRRGDKAKERFQNRFPTMDEYILEAESAIPIIFKEGQRPKLFVATDDCSMLEILRKARPQWIFVSQCDQLSEAQTGFDLTEISKLDNKKREEHFGKFFVELYALALSKVFIGVAYTNVAWWAFMMRPADKETFLLIDESVQGQDALNYW